ncbi:hypothetical protein [Acidithiobacillus sp. IBUN Pt1247-S3]|uniref:hypothetical protein n=1 Tax=Acidithiobacillus sp. IBUN Pt1247-S3 TaxID=3166642 RepID=UPI0034E4B154
MDRSCVVANGAAISVQEPQPPPTTNEPGGNVEVKLFPPSPIAAALPDTPDNASKRNADDAEPRSFQAARGEILGKAENTVFYIL